MIELENEMEARKEEIESKIKELGEEYFKDAEKKFFSKIKIEMQMHESLNKHDHSFYTRDICSCGKLYKDFVSIKERDFLEMNMKFKRILIHHANTNKAMVSYLIGLTAAEYTLDNYIKIIAPFMNKYRGIIIRAWQEVPAIKMVKSTPVDIKIGGIKTSWRFTSEFKSRPNIVLSNYFRYVGPKMVGDLQTGYFSMLNSISKIRHIYMKTTYRTTKIKDYIIARPEIFKGKNIGNKLKPVYIEFANNYIDFISQRYVYIKCFVTKVWYLILKKRLKFKDKNTIELNGKEYFEEGIFNKIMDSDFSSPIFRNINTYHPTEEV